MTSIAPALKTSLIVALLAWPLAAGLAVVLWSKARARSRERALARVEAGVRDFYRTVEGQPVPPRLAVTVEALQEAEEMAAIARAPATAPRDLVDAPR